MRYFKRLLIFVLIATPIFSVAQAQDVEELAYGDSASGEITDAENDVVYYGFEGAAGDQVAIEVNSSDTDPAVYLLDEEENVLAESDDISPDNYDSLIEYTLEEDGVYYIAVVAYDVGTFTVTLSGGAVSSVEDSVSGEIDDTNFYAEFPVTLSEGQVLSAVATATGGDLDTYLIVADTEYNILAENDDANATTTDSYLEYPVEADGEYLVVVSRYGLEEGNTAGSFDLVISTDADFGEGGGGSQPAVDADFDNVSTSPAERAEWTILAYFAGDNNLEPYAIIDLDEFEIAGGSTDQVRIVVLLDRSPEYDTSNDDWSTARIYEIGADSGQVDPSSPEGLPLIDTVEIADLGSIDSGTGSTLTDFLLWGIENYPAENYIVSVNDHGGAWTGLAGDDVTGNYILPFEFAEAFKVATEAAGMDRFALIINDACLMASVEYLDVVAPYFDYALGASEIMYGPGYDMTMLTAGLQSGTPIDQLGIGLIDRYMETMIRDGLEATQTPSLIDLHQFPAVSESVETFASVFNEQPDAYAQALGEARYNTYEYGEGSWLSFLVDVGDLMYQTQMMTDDPDLYNAAQGVIDAMNSAMVYSQRGSALPETASLYNVNFPASADDFISDYTEKTALFNWMELLSGYYNSFDSGYRTAARTAGGNVPTPPTVEPDTAMIDVLPPQVTITNIYPAAAPVSVNEQAIISMEVLGRNVVRGTFTVDQVQPDGSLRRVDTSDIVTFVEREDGTFDYINDWDGGVNDFDFTWEPSLTVLTDGTNTNIELITTRDNQSSITGRYRNNAETPWQEVVVIFNEEGYGLRALSTGTGGSGAAATIRLNPGGEFMAYEAHVTADGRVVNRPGNTYTIPEEGLTFDFTNAPSGEYNLGFLIEALGGATGFNSASITVDNDTIDPTLRGYTSLSDGFSLRYPADYATMEYLSERSYHFAADTDSTSSVYVYLRLDPTDLASTVQSVVDEYELTLTQEPTPITVNGQDALEFAYTDVSDDGRTFTGKGFAIYRTDLEAGYVYSVETTDGSDPSADYQNLLNNVTFIDVTEVKGADQGAWDWDFYTDNTYYPVPLSWLPGAESDFGWTYTVPEVPGAFAAVAVYDPSETDAATFVSEIATDYPGTQAGYTVTEKDTYFADELVWEVVHYTADGVSGRVYATVVDGTPYALWFEAPAEVAEAIFLDTFDLIVDGFEVFPVE